MRRADSGTSSGTSPIGTGPILQLFLVRNRAISGLTLSTLRTGYNAGNILEADLGIERRAAYLSKILRSVRTEPMYTHVPIVLAH